MASEQPKIKLYWLNDSRAQNTVWLLDELNLKYEVEAFRRSPTRQAPPELAEVHPLGKAPVLEITPAGGQQPVRLAESGYITQYLVEHFSQNKPSLVPKKWKDGQEGRVGGETEAYARFQYILHYVEGSFLPNLVQYLILSILKSNNVPFFIRPITSAVVGKIFSMVTRPDAERHLNLLDGFLKTAPGVDQKEGGFLCGPELTAADILISFGITGAEEWGAYDSMGSWPGGSARAAYPVVFAYVDRLKAQPGYQRALEKAKEIEGK
ncbi:putative glutathione s-transferase [Colletotrichum sojae]|uniref:Putative glutathione s-transferase n=1 Tax=Colletotrichum sojae TaxID=2175907 RepID=A0A8H6N1R3_9PEZI|nr:putative glutathione s-transferase [Colletotrichum sojae]